MGILDLLRIHLTGDLCWDLLVERQLLLLLWWIKLESRRRVDVCNLQCPFWFGMVHWQGCRTILAECRLLREWIG